jgi:G3E family GTPase
MTERIPVNVLTGFLGSGKTRMLNRLLRDPLFANCAVLINEFGSVGIDHHLVDQVIGDLLLLKSGCICCTIRGDLATALRDLYTRRDSGLIPRFTRVVVETTGLADPAPVVATVLYDRVLQHHFRVGNVITTVDALNGAANLVTHPECLKQVALADRLVLTKLDLANGDAAEALTQHLQAINPAACLVRTGASDLDAQLLLGDDVFDPAQKSQEVMRWLENTRNRQFLALRPPPAQPPNPIISGHEETHSFVICLPDAVDWTVFSVWLSLLLHQHGDRVLRVKGLLNIAGAETPVVLHGVQRLVYPPTHLAAWPDDDRQSRLVFIVRGLAASRIESSLHDYLVNYS